MGRFEPGPCYRSIWRLTQNRALCGLPPRLCIWSVPDDQFDRLRTAGSANPDRRRWPDARAGSILNDTLGDSGYCEVSTTSYMSGVENHLEYLALTAFRPAYLQGFLFLLSMSPFTPEGVPAPSDALRSRPSVPNGMGLNA